MSRHYEMIVTCHVRNQDEADAVADALNAEWGFDNRIDPYSYNVSKLWLCGRSSLCGGESEEEFAACCYKAVLGALQYPTEIEVTCTCLENLPCESYTCDEESAKRIIADIADEANRCPHGMFLAGAGACPACSEE